MSLLRILILAVLGVTATPSFAVPVRFTLESDDFTVWDYAFRDGDGTMVSGVVPDDDGDGVATFVADVDPAEPAVYMHSNASVMVCFVLLLAPGQTEGPFPLIRDATGNQLIVESAGAPIGPFLMGQSLTATDGTIAGLDGLLHENPGIPDAAALLATDISSLPNYSGGAVVEGLVSYEVIPEPSTWMLSALFSLAITCHYCMAKT